MKQNVGKIDRILRIALTATLAVMFALGLIPAVIAVGAGLVLILTSTAGFCPLYKVCHISSKRSSQGKE